MASEALLNTLFNLYSSGGEDNENVHGQRLDLHLNEMDSDSPSYSPTTEEENNKMDISSKNPSAVTSQEKIDTSPLQANTDNHPTGINQLKLDLASLDEKRELYIWLFVDSYENDAQVKCMWTL